MTRAQHLFSLSNSLLKLSFRWESHFRPMHLLLFLALICTFGKSGASQDEKKPANLNGVPPVPVANSEAKSEAEMKPYTDKIRHAKAKFDMVPIPGRSFGKSPPRFLPGSRRDRVPKPARFPVQIPERPLDASTREKLIQRSTKRSSVYSWRVSF